jgi:hypothetical protein
MTHILTLINDLVLQWCQGEQIYNYISYLCTEERNIPSKNRSKIGQKIGLEPSWGHNRTSKSSS